MGAEAKTGGILRAWGTAWLLVMMAACAYAGPASARQDPASIVIDANTGRTLHAQAADELRYPASLTKMMTLYVVFEEIAARRLKTSDRIRFSADAVARPPSKLGLDPGETISVNHAIRALITKSAIDVATAVAEHISETEADFARRMTMTARRLGMARTTFRNASGLPDRDQLTTARDMATLAMALRDSFPSHFRLFALRAFKYKGRNYRNHNRLLGRMPGIDGVKTGYTRASGFNIATSLRRDGKYLVGVVMGQSTGRKRNNLMRRLLASALPKATRGRRRKPAPMRVARSRLVERPKIAARPTVVGAAFSQTLSAAVAAPPLSQTASREPYVRARSTLDAQHLRRTMAFAAPSASPGRAASPPVPSQAVAGPYASTHQIQVGAFFDEADARRALDGARSRAGRLLAGSRALTLAVPGKPRTIYRARFSGFGERDAMATCAQLKRISVDCFVTTAR
jgi:D-alanyl-D-alanine carboxypeptidase